MQRESTKPLNLNFIFRQRVTTVKATLDREKIFEKITNTYGFNKTKLSLLGFLDSRHIFYSRKEWDKMLNRLEEGDVLTICCREKETRRDRNELRIVEEDKAHISDEKNKSNSPAQINGFKPNTINLFTIAHLIEDYDDFIIHKANNISNFFFIILLNQEVVFNVDLSINKMFEQVDIFFMIVGNVYRFLKKKNLLKTAGFKNKYNEEYKYSERILLFDRTQLIEQVPFKMNRIEFYKYVEDTIDTHSQKLRVKRMETEAVSKFRLDVLAILNDAFDIQKIDIYTFFDLKGLILLNEAFLKKIYHLYRTDNNKKKILKTCLKNRSNFTISAKKISMDFLEEVISDIFHIGKEANISNNMNHLNFSLLENNIIAVHEEFDKMSSESKEDEMLFKMGQLFINFVKSEMLIEEFFEHLHNIFEEIKGYNKHSREEHDEEKEEDNQEALHNSSFNSDDLNYIFKEITSDFKVEELSTIKQLVISKDENIIQILNYFLEDNDTEELVENLQLILENEKETEPEKQENEKDKEKEPVPQQNNNDPVLGITFKANNFPLARKITEDAKNKLNKINTDEINIEIEESKEISEHTESEEENEEEEDVPSIYSLSDEEIFYKQSEKEMRKNSKNNSKSREGSGLLKTGQFKVVNNVKEKNKVFDKVEIKQNDLNNESNKKQTNNIHEEFEDNTNSPIFEENPLSPQSLKKHSFDHSLVANSQNLLSNSGTSTQRNGTFFKFLDHSRQIKLNRQTFDKKQSRRRSTNHSGILKLKNMDISGDKSMISDLASNYQSVFNSKMIDANDERSYEFLYSYILNKVKNLKDEIFNNIMLFYREKKNNQNEVNAFNKELRYLLHFNEEEVLPIFFEFKWKPTNNEGLIKKLESKMSQNKIQSTTSHSQSRLDFYEKKNKIIVFLLALLTFIKDSKQLITKKHLLFFQTYLHTNDCYCLYGALELFIVMNDLDEFIDNLFKIYMYRNSEIFNEYGRAKLEEEDVEKMEQENLKVYDIMTHLVNDIQRNVFLDLIKNKNKAFYSMLSTEINKNSNPKKIAEQVRLFIKKMGKNVTQKKKDKKPLRVWNKDLRDAFDYFPQQKIMSLKNFTKILQLLEGNDDNDDVEILKGIHELWIFNNDKGELLENITIFNNMFDYKENKDEVDKVKDILQRAKIEESVIDIFIASLFYKQDDKTKVFKDFYNLYKLTKNESIMTNAIKTRFKEK